MSDCNSASLVTIERESASKITEYWKKYPVLKLLFAKRVIRSKPDAPERAANSLRLSPCLRMFSSAQSLVSTLWQCFRVRILRRSELLVLLLWTGLVGNAATNPSPFGLMMRTNLWRQESGPGMSLRSFSLIGNRAAAQWEDALAWLPARSPMEPGLLLVGAARGGDLRESGMVTALEHVSNSPPPLVETHRWPGRADSVGWGRRCQPNRRGPCSRSCPPFTRSFPGRGGGGCARKF